MLFFAPIYGLPWSGSVIGK